MGKVNKVFESKELKTCKLNSLFFVFQAKLNDLGIYCLSAYYKCRSAG